MSQVCNLIQYTVQNWNLLIGSVKLKKAGLQQSGMELIFYSIWLNSICVRKKIAVINDTLHFNCG